ncbi:hypothetical protein RIR_jg21219.t1 [Rhizophagus irregularis DAOM 181602=DAOM 197198]|nr:hypothetical protein RIR_jg21219.t1 [Rhizophagus irregularis DAOM 181602=DAOM 197198]
MTKDTSRIQYKEARSLATVLTLRTSLLKLKLQIYNQLPFANIFYSNICLIQNLGKFRCPVFYMTDDESLADEPDVTEFNHKVNKLRSRASKTVANTPPKLPNIEMTPVDQPVIPENSRKKDK